MGGGLIADILAAGAEKLANVERLILQPNNREDELRTWLMNNGFKLVAEKIMTENDKFYEIMVVEHGQMELSATELRFGPFLNQEKSDVFKARWQRELKNLKLLYHMFQKIVLMIALLFYKNGGYQGGNQ